MPRVGPLIVEAVDNGVSIKVDDRTAVLTPKEARNLVIVFRNLIPRIRDIQKEKLLNQISNLETSINAAKQKIKELEEQGKNEEKELG